MKNVCSSEPMLAECLLTAGQASISCNFQPKHAACRDRQFQYISEKKSHFFFSCIQEKVIFFSTLSFHLLQHYLSLRNIGVAKQLAPQVKHVCTSMNTKVNEA